MTEQEQNIAIAEACGWKKVEHAHSWDWIHADFPGWHPEPPDYVHDLNAMADAESCLDRDQQHQFVSTLADIFGGRITFMVSSDAKYRAEAFLRAIGKIPIDSPIVVITNAGTHRTIKPTVITPYNQHKE